MDTAWLKVFRAIADTGSFTAAAKRLGYTQSAVSRHMAALETELDETLFHRQARGVRLTQAGRFLLGHAQAVLDRLDAARHDLRELADLAAGRVRIGSFATAGVSLLPRTIAEFRARHPGVVLSHTDGLTRELVPRVVADELDVAIVNGYPDQVAVLPPTRLRKLCDEPMLVAMPREHRLADRSTVALSELADDDWIAGSPDPAETLFRSALRQGFTPRVAHVVREWTAKQGFVAAGLGVTLLPTLAADSVRADIALVALDADSTPLRGVYAATAEGVEPAVATTAFVALLAERARRLTVDFTPPKPRNRLPKVST